MIRKAKQNDLQEVQEVAQSVAIGNSENKNGFLMSAYTLADYKNFLSDTKNVTFLVSVDSGGRICGFLIAYNQNYARTLTNSNTVKTIRSTLGVSTPYYIIKQIAVAPGCQNQGHATNLYKEFLSAAGTAHVFTTIIAEPKNPASEGFHRSFGFTPYFDSFSVNSEGDKKYPSKIWYASAPSALASESDADPDVLIENLHHASTLYLHEDNLNWTKLKFLVTILFSLIVAAWALMQMPDWNASTSLASYGNLLIVILVIITGYVILTAVGAKIRSGLLFMASHKECVRLLEAKLATACPGVVGPVLKVPEVADTIKIMKRLPSLALLAWTAMSILLTAKIILLLLDWV